MQDNRFYVYAHLKPDGETFYIGRGTGSRIYSKVHRSKHWHSIVSKYGIEYKILEDQLTNDQANEREKYYINLFGRKLNGGSLINQTDGGDGLCGYIPTEETLKRKSEAIKGRIFKPIDADVVKDQFLSGLTIDEVAAKNGVIKTTLRKYIPKDIREKEILARRKKFETAIKFEKGNQPWNKGVPVFIGSDNPFYGKEHNAESRQKMAEKKEKKLVCLNNNLTYKSTLSAADKLQLVQSSVAKVARGYQKQTKGFVFKYL
jgi:hypothetical protein